MKRILFLRSFFILILICTSQTTYAQSEKTVPKIENYAKGELEIMIAPFGEGGNQISIGKITSDGIIHFNWPEIDLKNHETSDLFMLPLKMVFEEGFCDEMQKEKNASKVVKVKYMYLYKYGKRVATIAPIAKKEANNANTENLRSNLFLGSTISWFYSESDQTIKATCNNNIQWEDAYDFNQTTNFNVQFKKGWNLIEHRLLEIEDWKNETDQGSIAKTRSVTSIQQIPENTIWEMDYFANDEDIEIRRRLLQKTPITKTQYENWIPKKLGNLKCSSYEIGKQIEKVPTENNVYLTFEKNNKKIALTIVDCAANEKGGSMVTMIKGMAKTEWHDDKESGYSSSEKMGNVRVVLDFKEKEQAATVSYTLNDRFVVLAECSQMPPEEVLSVLEELSFENLIDE